jgi:hypothetical protein
MIISERRNDRPACGTASDMRLKFLLLSGLVRITYYGMIGNRKLLVRVRLHKPQHRALHLDPLFLDGPVLFLKIPAEKQQKYPERECGSRCHKRREGGRDFDETDGGHIVLLAVWYSDSINYIIGMKKYFII